LPKLTKPYMQRELADTVVRMNPQRRKGDRVVPLPGDIRSQSVYL
jgi:hypothetical protein